ncbi:hypothetical protein KFK09_026831 [Dendrobium nobile]|uniref:1-phosphatidylinositol 4-kinase n=2 Tax=Dendrobium nobile TaxID=94219 RepID=A0A8T3A8U6_DENNO|nr:hypothetical protein KFK09_026831 [Dendrobium nobile]
MSSATIALNPIGEDFSLSSFKRSAHCSPEPILVYLAVPGSSVIPMPVFESDSISSVKLRIQRCGGFMFKKQKLVFDGRELSRNDGLVRDYGVSDGNVLHLVIRLSDLGFVTVKTVCGKKIKFHIERNRTVSYVKQHIARRGKDLVDLENQKLCHDGKELDDHLMIQDICSYNDAVIHLIVRKCAKVRTQPIDKAINLSILAPTATDKDECKKPLKREVWIEPFVVNPKIILSPVIKKLIQSALAGLKKGNPPVMSSEGTGGAYFMQDVSGQEFVAVFKPIDEEPMAENNPRGLPLSLDGIGLKKGTRVGEGALREVAAYLLDHPISGRRTSMCDEFGFSGVPPTIMVQCLSDCFNHSKKFDRATPDFKVGSMQMYVKNCGSCEDMGPGAFPVEEIHKITVLDIRLANADRHGGNILFCKEGEEGRIVLVPIDHGYCLPEDFEDCTFEWLHWPQARIPYNAETVEYIKSLNVEEDIELLRFNGWELSSLCARTLRICTMLLKKGAQRSLSPYEIGRILCRETLKKESKIEGMIRKAKEAILPETCEAAFMESISQLMDRYFDELAE